ncbi:MAG: MalM family protein [Pseudomonadota bacterium]
MWSSATSRSRAKRVIGISLLSALLGCAPAYQEMVIAHKSVDVCCGSLSEISYQIVEVGESGSYKIDAKSPAFVFKGGKSYFKAFELPLYQVPYHISINSYGLDDGSGPKNLYIFHPEIITLDKGFNVVRRIPAERMQVSDASLGETAKISMSAVQVRIGIQLSIAKHNRNEKYFIIATSGKRLGGDTVFSRPFSYMGNVVMKNAPTGVVHVELLSPVQRNALLRKKWISVYESIDSGRHYHGKGVAVAAPQNSNYRFKNRSYVKYGTPTTDLDFISYMDSGVGRAFVKAYYLGTAYRDLSAEQTLAFVQELAEKSHRKTLEKVAIRSSTIDISENVCHRIDFSAVDPKQSALPTKGYDILCVHPAWQEGSRPLVVRVGANYLYGLDEDSVPFPNELKNFYQTVKFTPID